MELFSFSSFRSAATILLFALAVLHASAGVTERPRDFILSDDEFGWWSVKSDIVVDWQSEKAVMTGLRCAIRHRRYFQDGKSPMEISITHPVESADYKFQFQFNLPDSDLINRNVETITVGGRPYQRRMVQSRKIPWFGVYEADDMILAFGISREMYRPNESYPWLPLEFLIPQFFEVEGIKLGISGDFEIEHGEYETRYEEIYIDMGEFKQAFDWCYDHINPKPDHEARLRLQFKKRFGL